MDINNGFEADTEDSVINVIKYKKKKKLKRLNDGGKTEINIFNSMLKKLIIKDLI